MFRFFSSYQPLALVIILIIGLCFWLPSFFISSDNHESAVHFSGWLYSQILEPIQAYRYLSLSLGFVLMSVLAFLLVQLNVWHGFFKKRTYLPSFLFFSMMIPFSEFHLIHRALIPMICLVLILHKLFKMYRSEQLSYDIFEASLILGLGILFDSSFILFFPILLISLVILRAFNWREWLFSILGVMIVLLLVKGFYFAFTGDKIVLIDFSIGLINFNDLIQQSFLSKIWVGLLIVITLFSVIFLFSVITTKDLHARKFLIIIFWTLIMGTIGYVTDPVTSIYKIGWISVPLSFLITHYLLNLKKKFFLELITGIILLLMVLNSWIA